MEQVLFIVWRESVEALLVVGILYAWLGRSPQGRRGLPWLWGGVAAGVCLAVLLALVLLGLASWLDDSGQEWFQAIMSLIACALVVQMVVWMRRHGRRLRQDLQQGVSDQLGQGRQWGVLVLAMIAVAREGSETVVFLYGALSAVSAGQNIGALVWAALGGFFAALLTFMALQWGGRIITWRRFFAFTEWLLLMLGAALLISATDRLISLGALPALVDPVWDSSWLLGTDSGLGKLLADFAGYRDFPALSQVLIYVGYVALLFYFLRAPRSVTTLKAAS
ncbi:FTR1 family iron permease [Alcaligenes sp. SDU_A2]|uniref:FTR1 family iron permease n=1 Tax=Alcaligenes sp. SDU_A2 TaxID=3136634 RepID=UPI00311E9D08